MRTGRIRIDDIEISCSESGPSAAGRALVLVHGFTGHRDDFVDHVAALGETRRVLAPDLRGHGDASHSDLADRHTLEQLSDDLLRLLDALEIESCDLLGHSMGGMVSLRFALAHPQRVASLICMNTAPESPMGLARPGMQKAGAIARAKGMAELQRLAERSARANPDPLPSDRQTAKWAERYWEHHRRRYVAMDPAAFEGLGLAMIDQEPVTDRLGEITCPTSVLVGSDDETFLPGADLLERGIAGARRVTIPDAGHHPHIENPDAWRKALDEHFEMAAPRV